ncbi:hypothetical protein ACP70R_031094 [Stipagrostis hirtigluma subsp. patula]
MAASGIRMATHADTNAAISIYYYYLSKTQRCTAQHAGVHETFRQEEERRG